MIFFLDGNGVLNLTYHYPLDEKKIYIAGINGLVGSAVAKEMINIGLTVTGLKSKDLNLLDQKEVSSFFSRNRFDVVIFAAAMVGGIKANSTYPVDFINNNLQIQLNLFEACHDSNVERVVFLGSSCIYPRLAKQPISEEELLNGPLEETNRPYAIAKIAGIEQVRSYRRQYKRDWISVMPCNLYGENDYFNAEKSHVIPAMFIKFLQAKNKEASKITLWGSGNPTREFLHTQDFSKALIHIIKYYDQGSNSHINLGSNEEVSIKDLAIIISSVVGYHGEIVWDQSMPDGTPRKIMDSSKLQQLGWSPQIPLKDGLLRVHHWINQNTDSLRI